MRQLKISLMTLILGILGILLLMGCSGGTGSGPTDPTVSSSESGTVALFLRDGAVEDFDQILVTITKVALIPASDDDMDMDAYNDTEENTDADENDHTDPVVIFESDEGEEVDFLHYKDDPYLFLVDDTIPASRYDKIRLWVSDVQAVGGPCDDLDVVLPSGKIDLKPRGGFAVVPGEALAIELDLDLDKSLRIHEAGNSGKCIFRPVIFVDIYDHPAEMPTCPRIIPGTIEELIYDDGELVIGFDMLLTHSGRHSRPVTVMTENAFVFDGSGNNVNLNSLQVGDVVNVRGKLNGEGELDASLVVVGDVATVSGVTLSDFANGSFELEPDEGQVVVSSGEPLSVFVAQQSFILIGCDDEVDTSAIQEGMEALVVGKIDTSGNFLAALVVLRPEKISGILEAIEPEAGGHDFAILVDTDDVDAEPLHIFLPRNVPPHIKGDGLLPMGLLMEMVECENRPPVEVKLAPGAFNVAAELAVVPFDITGTVEEDADADDDLITLDVDDSEEDITIQVYDYATILDENVSLVGIEALEVGDTITSHGLEPCDGDITQISFVISVQGEAEEIPY